MSAEPDRLTPEPDPFADRLAGLTPAVGRFDRDALLYEAGRAAARPGRFWPAAAAALALLQAVTLAVLLPARTVPAVRERIAVHPAAGPASSGPPPEEPRPWDGRSGTPYLVLRGRAADGDLPARPADEMRLTPDEPPLTALGSPAGPPDPVEH
jgi:hypothetical protein